MTLSSKIQGLNYGAPILDLAKSKFFLCLCQLWLRQDGILSFSFSKKHKDNNFEFWAAAIYEPVITCFVTWVNYSCTSHRACCPPPPDVRQSPHVTTGSIPEFLIWRSITARFLQSPASFRDIASSLTVFTLLPFHSRLTRDSRFAVFSRHSWNSPGSL